MTGQRPQAGRFIQQKNQSKAFDAHDHIAAAIGNRIVERSKNLETAIRQFARRCRDWETSERRFPARNFMSTGIIQRVNLLEPKGQRKKKPLPAVLSKKLLTPMVQMKSGHPKPGSCDPRHSRRDSRPGSVQVPVGSICRVNLFCCRRAGRGFCTKCSNTIRSEFNSRK